MEISKFALPLVQQLKEAQKKNGCYPGVLHVSELEDKHRQEWQTILEKIVWSLEAVASDSYEDDNKVQEGLELFGKYFIHLWD